MAQLKPLAPFGTLTYNKIRKFYVCSCGTINPETTSWHSRAYCYEKRLSARRKALNAQ